MFITTASVNVCTQPTGSVCGHSAPGPVGTSLSLPNIDKKLTSSQSKGEIENFIHANLRIIIQETVFQKTLRTVALVRGRRHTYVHSRDKGSFVRMTH